MGSYVRLSWTERNTNVINLITKKEAAKIKTLSLNAGFSSLSSVSTDLIKQSTDGVVFVVKAPLLEDITHDYRSNFGPASEVAAGIADLGARIKTALSAVSGTTAGIFQIFDYQVWDNTEPVKINLELTFATETDTLYDVVLPTLSLCGLTALTSNTGGGWSVPGVNLRNMQKVSAAPSSGTTAASSAKSDPPVYKDPGSKFISFVSSTYVDEHMMVMEAKPTWSKIHTDSGYPAYSKVQLQLQSVNPASDLKLFNAIK